VLCQPAGRRPRPQRGYGQPLLRCPERSCPVPVRLEKLPPPKRLLRTSPRLAQPINSLGSFIAGAQNPAPNLGQIHPGRNRRRSPLARAARFQTASLISENMPPSPTFAVGHWHRDRSSRNGAAEIRTCWPPLRAGSAAISAVSKSFVGWHGTPGQTWPATFGCAGIAGVRALPFRCQRDRRWHLGTRLRKCEEVEHL